MLWPKTRRVTHSRRLAHCRISVHTGSMLVPAIVLITLALVFYTIGVWTERAQKLLKPWHAVFFGLGLAADASGT